MWLSPLKLPNESLQTKNPINGCWFYNQSHQRPEKSVDRLVLASLYILLSISPFVMRYEKLRLPEDSYPLEDFWRMLCILITLPTIQKSS